MKAEVLYQVQDGVATITMNRPQSLNSMNPGLIDGLHEALTKAAEDTAVRCLVLTGAGRAFCAGGDLGYLNGIESLAAKRSFINRVGDVARRITMLPKPVIAKVNGVSQVA